MHSVMVSIIVVSMSAVGGCMMVDEGLNRSFMREEGEVRLRHYILGCVRCIRFRVS
jgi:hypothetical protein